MAYGAFDETVCTAPLGPKLYVSAYDILMNKVVFSDMKLAGIIFICCGFLLVLTPTNWAAMLRKIIR